LSILGQRQQALRRQLQNDLPTSIRHALGRQGSLEDSAPPTKVQRVNEADVYQVEVVIRRDSEGEPVSELLLVGHKRSTELDYTKLSSADQRKCKLAMAKEWCTWQLFSATRPLTKAEFAAARKAGVLVVGTK
jgi:hypothetical protein